MVTILVASKIFLAASYQRCPVESGAGRSLRIALSSVRARCLAAARIDIASHQSREQATDFGLALLALGSWPDAYPLEGNVLVADMRGRADLRPSS